IFAIANIQTIIEVFSDDSKDEVAVKDETGELFTPLKESVEEANDDLQLVDYDGSEAEGKEQVENEDYEALIVLDLNEDQLPEATYFANTVTNSGQQAVIEQQLQQLKVSVATQQAGI